MPPWHQPASHPPETVKAADSTGSVLAGIMLAALLRMPQAQPVGQEPGAGASSSSQEASWQLEQQLEMCRALEAAVAAFQLEGCWDWKPLLNGNQASAHRVLEWHQCAARERGESCRRGPGAFCRVGLADPKLKATSLGCCH